MRTLVVGNVTTDYGAEALLVRALRRAGHEVIEVFYPTNREDYSIFNYNLEQTIRKNKDCLVLVGKVVGLKYEDIVRLKKIYNVPIVQMTYDLMRKLAYDDRTKWWYPQIQEGGFDWVFGASDNKEDKNNIKKYTSKYSCLREGVDIELHQPIRTQFEDNKKKYQADVAFTGAAYNDFRKKMICSFNHEKSFKFRHHYNVFLTELAKMASVTQMSIGTNYEDNIQGYWSARAFENMGVGLAFLTPNIKGMREQGLIDKKTCIFYNPRDLEDLRNKILYYKDNHEETDKIKKKAIQLIFKYHTFDERVKTIFKVLKKQKVI